MESPSMTKVLSFFAVASCICPACEELNHLGCQFGGFNLKYPLVLINVPTYIIAHLFQEMIASC